MKNRFKLTAVTITAQGKKLQFFTTGLYNEETGKTTVSSELINKKLNQLNLKRGDTYTIG